MFHDYVVEDTSISMQRTGAGTSIQEKSVYTPCEGSQQSRSNSCLQQLLTHVDLPIWTGGYQRHPKHLLGSADQLSHDLHTGKLPQRPHSEAANEDGYGAVVQEGSSDSLWRQHHKFVVRS